MKKRILIAELVNVDIELVNKEDLVDASNVTFDYTVPQEQRAGHMVATVNNPYCFRVGDMGVKLEFLENTPSLQEVFTDYLKRKKSGL